jgi:hypothetical protein
MEINAELERFLGDNAMIIGDSGFQCEPWLLSSAEDVVASPTCTD